MLLLRKFFPFKKKRIVLFHRDFQAFTGGHLKTFNYFQYVQKMSGFSAKIYFSESSAWDNNPWKGECIPEKKWDPLAADILFLAGLDWGSLDGIEIDENIPVINLIQGIRHSDPNDVRYTYLAHKAIRICVSKEIAKALEKTQKVNGPIYTIPNGIDLDFISSVVSGSTIGRKLDVLISGLKNPDLAISLEKRLKAHNYKVECITEKIPRKSYLKKISTAKLSLLLPYDQEGFYLPALESMALGAFTVCPDCIGNRDFCFDDVNCMMPDYDIDSFVSKTVEALNKDLFSFKAIINEGLMTAKAHNIQAEKNSFKNIMKNIDSIWNQK